MANLTVIQNQSNHSPFDSIRRFDENGLECWYARELMSLLGYAKWQRFEEAIARAEIACENAGEAKALHINHLPGSVSGNGRFGDNYKLSRHACHLIAMNGDPRKPEVAAAQKYFSFKTREAEVVIPAQQDEIWHWKARALEAEERLIAKREAVTQLHPPHIAGLILGANVEVPEVEKPVIEVIDSRHNLRFKGQTLAQMVEFLRNRHGVKFKSGAELKRYLERQKQGGLIAQTLRSVASDYIPEEHLAAAYEVILTGDRQKLIGE